MTPTQQAVEQAVRNSYGRLLAYLAARSGDISGAEDALSGALYAALRTWPERGIPDNPEAWLLQTARRRIIDEARRHKVQERHMPNLVRDHESQPSPLQELLQQDIFPDERLKLMFVCAHPAIDPSVRTALLLQTVLGFDANWIASVFLVAPAAMSQRLVRAKQKIRDAKIPFLVPEKEDLGPRLDAVLEAIYAVYGQGWDMVPGTETAMRDLSAEGISLARLMVRFLPEEPEVRGLLALLLFCEARKTARRNEQGAYIPLSEQDTSLWCSVQIAEAESHLQSAARQRKPGRFQLEAAIQSAHTARRTLGTMRWDVVAQLYLGLLHFAPTVGAMVSYAAALAEWQGAEKGLEQLDTLPTDQVNKYQPYWAVRAALLRRASRFEEAIHAYDRAAGLTQDPVIRTFLLTERKATAEESAKTRSD